jgi:hypothetical protein
VISLLTAIVALWDLVEVIIEESVDRKSSEDCKTMCMNLIFGIIAAGAVGALIWWLATYGDVDKSKNSSCPIMNFSNCSDFCDRCQPGCDKCNYVNDCTSLKCFYPF